MPLVEARPAVPEAEGAESARPHRWDADEIRDRIAARAQRADQRCPQALDLEARVLARMHEAICGAASALAGTHPPQHFREMLLGGRPLPLGDLCRLALSYRPEAGHAVDGALAILAESRGYRLDPARAVAVALSEAAARFATETAEVAAATVRALDDGHADAHELDQIERELAEAEQASAQMRAAIAAARRRA